MSNRTNNRPADILAGFLLALSLAGSLFLAHYHSTEERMSTVTAQVERREEEIHGLKVEVEENAVSADVWKAKAERHYAEKRALKAKLSAKRQKERALEAQKSTPKGYARWLLAERGQSAQWSCLERLWEEESGWRVHADNPSSSAYGIPQALPGSKMGAGWQSDFKVQIRWGLRYIAGRYGSPCNALRFKHGRGYY